MIVMIMMPMVKKYKTKMCHKVVTLIRFIKDDDDENDDGGELSNE